MSSTTNYDMSATTANVSPNEMSTLSSIYIPRVFANLSTEFVAETFENLNLGVVDRVETVPRPGDKTTYMAFVYFASWNSGNKAAANLAKRINCPNPGASQARIVYDDPWFWILLPNKSEKISSSKKASEDEFLEEFNRSNGISAQEWEQQQARKKEDEKLKKEIEDLMVDAEIDEALREQELAVDEKVDILYDMIEDLQVRLLESEKKNKKIESLEKELYNLRTMMLTGEPANEGDYEYWTRRQSKAEEETGENMSASVFEMDMEYIPSPPKLVRQTARCYNFDDMPSSPPKLIRQNACVGGGMMTPPPPPRGIGPRQTQVPVGTDYVHPNPEEVQSRITAEIAEFQKMKKDWETETGLNWMKTKLADTPYATRVDGMGLVYSAKDDDDKNFWCDP